MGSHYTSVVDRFAQSFKRTVLPKLPTLPASQETGKPSYPRESLPCDSEFTNMLDEPVDIEEPSKLFLFSDDRVICFRSPKPCAILHVVVVPRQRIRDIFSLHATTADIELL